MNCFSDQNCSSTCKRPWIPPSVPVRFATLRKQEPIIDSGERNSLVEVGNGNRMGKMTIGDRVYRDETEQGTGINRNWR